MCNVCERGESEKYFVSKTRISTRNNREMNGIHIRHTVTVGPRGERGESHTGVIYEVEVRPHRAHEPFAFSTCEDEVLDIKQLLPQSLATMHHITSHI